METSNAPRRHADTPDKASVLTDDRTTATTDDSDDSDDSDDMYTLHKAVVSQTFHQLLLWEIFIIHLLDLHCYLNPLVR